MERVLENLDRRLSRVEQFLPTLATKNDLERFATKQDLERFATKHELERFATKHELERFATKQELERTKHELLEEIDGARRHADVLFEAVRDDIRLVAEGVASLIERLERKGII
jgi:hypothetical protein